MRRSSSKFRRLPLFWRVFVTNALVLTVATAVLVLSPATVSFPVALTEAIVLALGLGAMLALNYALLGRVLSPLEVPELSAVTDGFHEMVARLEAERRDSAGRALAAQEGERLRVARELHDEVGQKLTAVMLQLDGLSRGRHAAPLEEAREGVRDALEEVRFIARRLRPEALDHLGLVSALTALTNALGRSAGVRIERRIDRSLPQLEPDAELVLYRVAQEALTNVVRHADSDDARLTLRRVAGRLELEVTDTGRGFDVESVGEGAGIKGMRERAMLVGAELEISSMPGSGTTVRLYAAPAASS